MAIEYHQRNRPGEFIFNGDALTYTINLLFYAEGYTDPWDVVEHEAFGEYTTTDWSTGQARLPGTCALVHNGRQWDHDMSAWVASTLCYPVGRKVIAQTTGSTLTVKYTMEGRVIGTHRCESRTQMISETLLYDLTLNAAGRHPGIGTDETGAPIGVPMLVYSALQCLPLWPSTPPADVSLESMRYLADIIAGSVNEQGWKPPWTDTFTLNEGWYVYLGMTLVSIDRRTRTALVRHEFMRVQSRSLQQIYRWRTWRPDSNSIPPNVKRLYDPGEHTGTILKIAGTDDWWDGVTGIPEFSTLLLDHLIF